MADDAAAPDRELSESTPTDATSSAVEPESTAIEITEVTGDATDGVSDEVNDDEADGADDADKEAAKPVKAPMSPIGLATVIGLVLVLALAGLTGWLGFRAYESRQAEQQRELFLQVGRQGALNLTTIDWQQAEGDVQRVLDSATGTFYDDFQKRAEPFVEVVKQAQSKSTGTISEAGLVEPVTDNEGQVLVAVTVETSNAGAPNQQPRAWRMRLTVQQVDDGAKVSNVEFVP